MTFQFNGIRYLILFVSTLCLTSVLSNMNTYNFTKICIEPNGTNTKSEQDKWEENVLQSSVAIGGLASSIPIAYAMQRYSHKYVFLTAGAISTVATALVPIANKTGFWYFLVVRILQGIAFSSTFPMAGSITSRWASIKENGIFIAFLTGNTQLANIFTMPVSGALCASSLGWESVYYVHAGLALVVFSMFAFFFTDQPEEHGLVTELELATISEGKEPSMGGTAKETPYLKMLTSVILWACWIAAFGDLIAVQLVSMFNPQYMKDYLHYDIFQSGFLAALPIIVQFCFKIFSGVVSDAITSISETAKVKIFNSICLGASAIFFIVLAFVPSDQHLLAIIVLVVAESLLGFNTAGFNKATCLHSRQYSHFGLQMIINLWDVTILVEPFFFNAFVKENVYADWRNCFIAHAVLLLICNTVFVFFASAEPAPWTHQPEDLIGDTEAFKNLASDTDDSQKRE